MLSDRWCYYSEPECLKHEVLRVNFPISKKQAIYILKKKFQIQKIYYIISCKELEKGSSK